MTDFCIAHESKPFLTAFFLNGSLRIRTRTSNELFCFQFLKSYKVHKIITALIIMELRSSDWSKLYVLGLSKMGFSKTLFIYFILLNCLSLVVTE